MLEALREGVAVGVVLRLAVDRDEEPEQHAGHGRVDAAGVHEDPREEGREPRAGRGWSLALEEQAPGGKGDDEASSQRNSTVSV